MPPKDKPILSETDSKASFHFLICSPLEVLANLQKLRPNSAFWYLTDAAFTLKKMGITCSLRLSALFFIFASSFRHQRDSAYLFENIVRAILDCLILAKRCLRSFPFCSSLSMKKLIRCLLKASTRWLTKLQRSSSPRKLMKTWLSLWLWRGPDKVSFAGILLLIFLMLVKMCSLDVSNEE